MAEDPTAGTVHQTAPVIYLARHGETAFNAERRFQGHLPVPLNDLGREQAHALAALAAQDTFVRLFASPLARARETAGIVASRIGLEPSFDARLVETDTGAWTGRLFADVQAEDPEGFAAYERADAGFRYPGGESFEEQRVRVAAALEEVAGAPGPALVVTHRGSIRLALAHARDEQGLRASVVPNATLVPLNDGPPRPGSA